MFIKEADQRPMGRWAAVAFAGLLLLASSVMIWQGSAKRQPPPPEYEPPPQTVATEPIAFPPEPSAAPRDRPPRPSPSQKNPPAGLQIVRRLPRTDAELEAAFRRARSNRCQLVPTGEPLELTRFTASLTQRDRAAGAAHAPPNPSLRRSAFAVGLELSPTDAHELPFVTRGPILSYLRDHFVSIQARVQRDPLTGERYLHHRPLAAAAAFAGPHLTQQPEAAVVSAVQDFRSLGLLLAADAAPEYRELRTVALVHRHLLEPRTATGNATRPNYEFAFLHAQPGDGSGSDPLLLHAFVTSGGRARLHHLRSGLPTTRDDCGILAGVRLTEFAYAGTYPTSSVVRKVTLRSRQEFALDQLDRYAESQNWPGDALDHLPRIFDAILGGELSPVGRGALHD